MLSYGVSKLPFKWYIEARLKPVKSADFEVGYNLSPPMESKRRTWQI